MKKITNDLPENKVRHHFSSKQYDKVIKAVESISDNLRTPQHYMLRAKSRYELFDSKSSRTGAEISQVFADFRKAIEL